LPESLNPNITFGIISDVQYCDCDPWHNRYYRKALHKIGDCVEIFNGMGLDFVMHLGDLIDHDFSSFDPALEVMSRLTALVYHLPGNHDYSIDDRYKPLVTQKYGLTTTHYEFSHDDWRFITLDGNEVSLFVDAECSEGYWRASALLTELQSRGIDSARPWNGAVSQSQLGKLESKLQAAHTAGEQVIIFCHYPVHPAHTHNLWNDREVVDVIGKHPCVRAFINGHQHQGGYLFHNGVHYLTVKGMVDTEQDTAFSVVRIFSDRIEVQGYGREEDRVLGLS
jgi:manganese-dependent ADP-ribose/CDP-alcohol diphosphatase